MRVLITAWITFLSLISSALFALHRDYKSDCEEDNQYQFYYEPYCLNHSPGNYQQWLSSSLAKYIPAKGPTCCKCNNHSVYVGYLDPDFRKYRSHLIHQLEYCRKHSKCHCYWPEYSSQAAEISDKAYLLFRDLITTTALASLLKNEDEQRKFIDNPGWFLNKHGLTISFIAQQFRFSDYYHICKDIENYALANYSSKDVAKIRDRLYFILEALSSKFYPLYKSCQAKHPNHDIEQEIRLIRLLANDATALETSFGDTVFLADSYEEDECYDVAEFIVSNLKTADWPVKLESKGVRVKDKSFQSNSVYTESIDLIDFSPIVNFNSAMRTFSAQSEILLEEGTILNNLLLHKKAIEVLTQAIKLNSSNREAYLERALAYFETNQIQLALKDYEKINQLALPPFKVGIDPALRAMYIPKHKRDFAEGLIRGVLDGAHSSALEMIPSILSCCRGILHGLWAFATSPSQMTVEMVDAAYVLGEYINNHDAIECLECVIPELKDLSLTWHKIDNYHRGKKIGYMIGKYGFEIFAPLGAIKGASKLKAGILKLKHFKRANTGQTLDRCAKSQSAERRILEKSIEFVERRDVHIIEIRTSGKIYPKSANVPPHILQNKHAWDKVVTIKKPIKAKENIEENFKSILDLLERENIISEKYFAETVFSKNNLKANKHTKVINNEVVEVIFEVNTETNTILLQDAWVVTNK
jgi:tetratricopeptide (TPR) repeat protein